MERLLSQGQRGGDRCERRLRVATDWRSDTLGTRADIWKGLPVGTDTLPGVMKNEFSRCDVNTSDPSAACLHCVPL